MYKIRSKIEKKTAKKYGLLNVKICAHTFDAVLIRSKLSTFVIYLLVAKNSQKNSSSKGESFFMISYAFFVIKNFVNREIGTLKIL